MVQQPWRTVWRFLKKLKIELPYDPAIPLLSIYSEDTKILIEKIPASPMFIDFPGGSDSKVSAYNAGDLGSIPGLGRSSGEGNGNPPQYSCLQKSHEWRSVIGYSP